MLFAAHLSLDSTSSKMTSLRRVEGKTKILPVFCTKLTVSDSPAGQQKGNWRMRFVFYIFMAVMEELVQRSAAFSVFLI